MTTQNLGRVVGFSILSGAGVPSGGLGDNGDSYLNTTNGDVYSKTGGTWSITGNIKGEQGVQGFSILSGAGAPTTQGVNGDTYLNTTNGDVYLKGGGVWAVNGNIKGVTGDKGWTPKHTLEADGVDRDVWKLTSYIGGTGTPPTANLNEYLKNDNTYTADKSLAARANGATGSPGISTTNMTIANRLLGSDESAVPSAPKQLSVVGASIVSNVFTINYQNAVSAYVAASGVDTPLTNAMSPIQMFQNLQKQVDARILNTGSSTNLILGNGTYQAVSDFVLATQKGAANGVVPLNASTLIDQVYLPSYVDDIIEGYKSGANFYKEVGLTTLITGETGKIYIDLTSGQKDKQYRWSGSAYIQITNGLIASTNDVPEGGSNLYFTVARVLATVISGFSAAAGVVANTDTILQAINKIVGNITAVNTALALKADIAAATGTLVALTFTSDSVQGTIASPLTGNITGNITGAKLGVVTLVIHNHTTAPTFDSKYKKLSGSGSYVTGSINYIFCEYINDTEIIYSINQRT